VKQKYAMVFILIFINLTAAFAQKKEVVWHGYEVKGGNADFKTQKRFFDDSLYQAITMLDENNGYLDIFAGYIGRVPTSPKYFYEITGEVEQYSGIYVVSTQLWEAPNNKLVFSPPLKKYDSNETGMNTIIQQHANTIYGYFENLVRIEKEGNLEQLLTDFDREYMQKTGSLNAEEFDQAMQRLSIIEGIFGKLDEIDNRRRGIEYSAVAILLARAEDNIASAFDRRIPNDSSESFCNAAEIFASQVRQIIGQLKNPSFHLRLDRIESKIDEYRNRAQFAVYTGGLGVFIEKPLPVTLIGPVIDFQKAYPGILGLNLRYVIPFDLPMQWYFQFSYTGGGMKEIPIAYVTEAAIHSFSLSAGMHLQFYINRIIAPYGYFGIGYTHLIEYASDGKDRAFLNFPGMIADAGIGTRFHLTPKFALEAKAEWNLLIYENIMMAVNFSLGASYLFHGKEYIIRR
jgi:hypothetical protein